MDLFTRSFRPIDEIYLESDRKSQPETLLYILYSETVVIYKYLMYIVDSRYDRTVLSKFLIYSSSPSVSEHIVYDIESDTYKSKFLQAQYRVCIIEEVRYDLSLYCYNNKVYKIIIYDSFSIDYNQYCIEFDIFDNISPNSINDVFIYDKLIRSVALEEEEL
jgi:hypothetical protein